MNTKLIIISTALLISNLGFAYNIQTIKMVDLPVKEHNLYDITHAVSTHLNNRGIDNSVSKELTLRSLGVTALEANSMLKVLQEECHILSLSHITKFIATKALHRQEVNLASYDTLIAIAQSQKGLVIDPQILGQLQKVAQKNSHQLQQFTA